VTVNVIDFFHAINVNEKQKHTAARAAGKFQLPFCESQKASPIVESRQFVHERKIAKLGLQHVLLCRALKRALEQVANRLASNAIQQRGIGSIPHVSHQRGKFPICFSQQTLKYLIQIFVRSSGAPPAVSKMKKGFAAHRDNQPRKVFYAARGPEDSRTAL
jgi:hypothetical protein